MQKSTGLKKENRLHCIIQITSLFFIKLRSKHMTIFTVRKS